MSEDMKKEQFLASLEEMLENEEKYTIVKYFKENTGVFLTAVSLFAALIVFLARTICYLIESISCRYWNLDESFITENDRAYLKLGVYILIIVITSAAVVMAKRYAYLWELYDCQIYLLSKLEKQQKRKIKSFKKEIKDIGKGLDLAEKAERILKDHEDYPFKNGEVDALREDYEQIKKDIKKTQKEYRDLVPLKLKWKRIHIGYLGVGFFVIAIASFMIQISIGLNLGDSSFIRIIQSSLVYAFIMMAGLLLSGWVNIKFKFRHVINSYLKEKDITLDQECKIQIMNLLESKADELRNKEIKQEFPDKSCKSLALFILFYAIATMLTLPIVAQYNLCHADTFYVTEDVNQDYVLVANYGNNYYFSQCDILDDEILIDTCRIYVTKAPIKMEKRSFKSVEKR